MVLEDIGEETVKTAIAGAQSALDTVVNNAIVKAEVAIRAIVDETFANITDLMIVIEPITIPGIVIKVQRRTLPKH